MAVSAAAAPGARVSPPAGRRILVAGASRGLGLGLAKSFAAHGWNVVGTERGASAGLRAVAEAAPGRIQIERLDINDTDLVQNLRRRLAHELFDVNAPVDLANSVEGLYRTLLKWEGTRELAFLDYQGNILSW